MSVLSARSLSLVLGDSSREGVTYAPMKREKRRVATDEAAPATGGVGELLRPLNAIALSLGALAVRLGPARPKSDHERVRLLRGFGFTNAEVAAILDTTPNTVAVRLSEGKKKARRRARGKNRR